jgi:N-acetylneuraminic acid mutarotase
VNAAGSSGPQGSPWTTAAPLDTARQEVAVAAVSGRVIVVGGLLENGSTSTAVELWDPGSDAWSPAADLPVPLHHTTATTVDGTVYVIGGWSDFFQTPLAVCLAYDPLADTWSTRAAMPTARGSPAAAAIAGRIHVVGGWNGGSLGVHEVYDPVSDSWSGAAPMPTARNHLGAASVDGTLLAVGGRVGLGAGVANVAAVEAWSAVTGTWSVGAALPEARGGLAVSALGGRIYALGGEGNDADPSGVFAEVEAYDLEHDAWLPRAPMPTPRHGIGAAALDGALHVPGGSTLEGFGVTAVHEVYRPARDVPIGVPSLAPAGLAILLLGAIALGLLSRPAASSACRGSACRRSHQHPDRGA